jgi:osmoprotectant transport system substrate-binding protein
MWEYTGTALTTYLGKKPSPDPKKTYQRVKKLDKKNGLLWMNMSQVNNTYALAMRKKEAKKLGIHSISDLAEYVRKHPGKLKMASEAEFTNRPDGLPGVQKKYNFKFGASNVKSMQTGLYYRAIHSHSVDVTVAYSTDPQIKKYNLVLLKDDKHFFPPYYAAVCINKDVYEKYPEIKEITKPLAEHLNSDIMRSLNYQVDVEGKSVSVVAHNWLVKNGLLKD